MSYFNKKIATTIVYSIIFIRICNLYVARWKGIEIDCFNTDLTLRGTGIFTMRNKGKVKLCPLLSWGSILRFIYLTEDTATPYWVLLMNEVRDINPIQYQIIPLLLTTERNEERGELETYSAVPCRFVVMITMRKSVLEVAPSQSTAKNRHWTLSQSYNKRIFSKYTFYSIYSYILIPDI